MHAEHVSNRGNGDKMRKYVLRKGDTFLSKIPSTDWVDLDLDTNFAPLPNFDKLYLALLDLKDSQEFPHFQPRFVSMRSIVLYFLANSRD
jgi:hypothetical protein